MGVAEVQTRLWREGALAMENFPLADLSDHLATEGSLVWADLCTPDEQLLAELAEELCLDRHAVEDAVAQHERPKATRYSTHVFLTTYAITHDPATGELQSSRVSAFVMPRGLITVRLDDGFTMHEVLQRWDDNADLIPYGPRALVHGLLDDIVDGYFEAIESLDDQLEQLEDVLFDENPRVLKDMQRRTFAMRKSLVQARRTILPMREVVNTVMRRAVDDPHTAELAAYYDDLYDHVLRVAEWTESLRDMITSIFETNMSLADARMNQIMKKLTSWAAIIAVPTAITGYFGQNVPYPGFGKMDGFYGSIAAMLLIAFALYVTFRRKEWL